MTSKCDPKSTLELYFSCFVFGTIFASISDLILEPFWSQKRSPEALENEKAILQKHLFYLSKTILFEVWPSPGTTKNVTKTLSEFDSEFSWFLAPKMTSKWSHKLPTSDKKSVKMSTWFLDDFWLRKWLQNDSEWAQNWYKHNSKDDSKMNPE